MGITSEVFQKTGRELPNLSYELGTNNKIDIGNDEGSSVLSLINADTLKLERYVVLDKDAIKNQEDIVNILEFLINRLNIVIPQECTIPQLEKYLKK